MLKGVFRHSLLILFLSYNGFGQNVNGVISTSENFLLQGVNVSVINQSKGTISDGNGKYSIDVSANREQSYLFFFYWLQNQKINSTNAQKGAKL